MEILQEIGAYAGLAAIVGLALLSALYFSQARDVRRLREWAGKAPERTSEPAAQAPKVAARPAPTTPAGAGTTPGLRPPPLGAPAPVPSPAKAATAGAVAAVAAGPAAATPAAARVADPPREDHPPGGGGEENGVSQDTMAHPAPLPLDDEDPDEEIHDVERVDPDLENDPDLGDEVDLDDEIAEAEILDEDDEDGGDELEYDDPEEEEVTGDNSAAAALRPAVPSRPVAPAPLASPGARRATPAGASGPILPPYERSRPGGDRQSHGTFSSRGRAAAVIGAAILVLAAATLGGLQLAKDDAGGGEPGAPSSSRAGATGSSGQPKSSSAIDPKSVTVAVLNGTTIQGAAQGVGDSVEGEGYELGTVSNFTDQTRAESVVLYSPGAEREAADVMRRLKINQREPIDPSSQSLAGDASVVVLVGADKAD